MTKKLESKIGAAEMRVLRLIKGVTRLDRMRNIDIRRNLEINSIVSIISQNNLRWYGHVKRMEQDRYPRKYLEWQPNTKRPPGRPKKRWMDTVKENLKDRNINIKEVEEQRKFEDHTEWKRMIARPDV